MSVDKEIWDLRERVTTLEARMGSIERSISRLSTITLAVQVDAKSFQRQLETRLDNILDLLTKTYAPRKP